MNADDTPVAVHDRHVELLSKETVFSSFLSIVRYRLRHSLAAGGVSNVLDRDLLLRRNAASVLPYDPQLDSVVLVEQFRIGAFAAGRDGWTQELVAGIVEEGEGEEDVARREAQEEAGLEIGRIKRAAQFMSSPGGSSEVMTVFIGEADASTARGIHGIITAGEETRPYSVTVDTAMRMIESGSIFDATTIIALQWLARNHGDLRHEWLSPKQN